MRGRSLGNGQKEPDILFQVEGIKSNLSENTTLEENEETGTESINTVR